MNIKDIAKQTILLTVPDRLKKLGNLFEERNHLFSDNYHHFGKICGGLFPNGLHLETEEEHNRYVIFIQLVHKLSRYSNTIKNGGHKDSLNDFSVYAQMLAEYDEIAEQQREFSKKRTSEQKLIDDLQLEIRRLKQEKSLSARNMKKAVLR
jgi:hypothetical protein